MSHFITVVSAHRSTGEAMVEHFNERFINNVNFSKDPTNVYDVANVWLIDPDSDQGDQLYARYIKHRMDAEFLLVSQMGFNRKLFDAMVFQFEGSIIKEEQ